MLPDDCSDFGPAVGFDACGWHHQQMIGLALVAASLLKRKIIKKFDKISTNNINTLILETCSGKTFCIS